ncbi:aspartate aminotransferase [Metarhizium guizhouense ARSEF 977]|uniref:Aspartate aminotransferase n=1 Tax=Metarhizium guizhouense (strain ARSEF 977) TaxID=1276136 RepID=A0A0B4GUZ4_METGA|nr:aspartate aminotransferase [Metarhizium guizhouense ARSEF 977]
MATSLPKHQTAAHILLVPEQGPKCKVTLQATPGADALDPDLKLDYGPFEGSTKLRMCIAELHSTPEVPSKPNNPIGSILSRSFLEEVVALAKRFNIAIFCDEVLTPLFHTDDPTPPPVESLGYENSVSTDSLSKAYGLPGVRSRMGDIQKRCPSAQNTHSKGLHHHLCLTTGRWSRGIRPWSRGASETFEA